MARASGLGLSLQALGGRLGGQWERERRDTLFLMGATLLTVIPHAGHLPWWATSGFLLLFLWRLGLVLSGRWLPRDSVRWVTAIASATAVYAEYGTLFGRDPGVALLVLFLGLKLMEMRARRDLFIVIFLCFFLLLTTFFHSQSMLTGALTMLAVLALLAAMLTMQFGGKELPVATRFRSVGTLVLQALPVAALLFVLFPRIQGPLWGMPNDAFGAGTGLSESMSPGRISGLTESDSVAFRAQFEGRAPKPGDLYWRGPAFGHFDGLTWRPLTRPSAPFPLASIQGDPASTLRYTVTMEPNGRHWLFALEAPVRVGLLPPGGAALMHDMLLLSRERITDRLRYSVESQTEHRFGLNETPASLRNWLQLPEGFNPRTLALADLWRGETADDWQKVQRVLGYFSREAFHYTLRPPLLGRDGIDDFLFRTRQGFCEHYAGAFVVLMRAMNVPARVVTGYQGGERNPVDGFWVIRQADAHAWAEVWLDGRGWVRVDPTAAIAPERIERGSRTFRIAQGEGAPLLDIDLIDTLKFNLDALGNAWNQWVLSYDRSRQEKLLAGLGLSTRDWRDLVGLLAVGLVVAIGVVALITLHPRRARDPVVRSFAEFCDRLAASGVIREPHETSNALLRRAAGALQGEALERAGRIVALYNDLHYGVDAPARHERVRHLRKLVHAFRP